MSNNSSVSTILSRAAQIASTTNHPRNNPQTHVPFSNLSAHNLSPPKLLIISCADPRLDTETIFNLQPMEAAVFRNPGGHVAPNINGLLALDHLVGGFEEMLILHHTDCGTSMYTDGEVREVLRKRVKGVDVEGLTFGAIDGAKVEESVRDDLKYLREHPLVRAELKEVAVGAVYDVETGVITKVDG